MKYDISKKSAPKMPTLGKGTECIKILLSQTSKDMHEPLVPMLFPILGAHVSGSEFQYPDFSWKDGRPRNGVSRLSKRRIKGHETAYRERPNDVRI